MAKPKKVKTEEVLDTLPVEELETPIQVENIVDVIGETLLEEEILPVAEDVLEEEITAEVQEEKKEEPKEEEVKEETAPVPVKILQRSPSKLRVLYSDGDIRWITKIDFKGQL